MPANMYSKDDFLNRDQIANFLNISVRTLSRRHAEGSGPPRIKHGGIILYYLPSVSEWLISQERECVRSPL